jgi:hypothetical protein
MIKIKKTCILIDVDDSDVNTIKAEKLGKYKDLEIGASRI